MKVARDTGYLWPHLEIERSRSPGQLTTWPKSPPYLWNGKAYELQTWCAGGVRWPTCEVTCIVKSLGGCLRMGALSIDGRHPSRLILSWEQKGVGSWKLAWRKPVTRSPVTPFRDQKIVCGNFQLERSVWLFKSPLAGGGRTTDYTAC